jgi:hypothetical protein
MIAFNQRLRDGDGGDQQRDYRDRASVMTALWRG